MAACGAYACILQRDNVLVETEKACNDVLKVISLIAESVDMSGPFRKVAADESIPMRILLSFLEHVRKDFFDKFVNGPKTQKLSRNKYRKYMSTELEFFITNKDPEGIRHPAELDHDKLRGSIAEVAEIKDIMAKNLQRTIERGQRLEDLQVQTALLESFAQEFAKTQEPIDVVQEKTSLLEGNAQELQKDAKKLRCHKCRKYYCCCFASCCNLCCT